MSVAPEALAASTWNAFRRAYEAGHDKYVDFAKKCDDFVCNEQWDPARKREIEAGGRPALTFNQIIPVLNAIRGHYSSQQADIRYTPKGGGASVEVGEILTRLADDILDVNMYHTVIEPAMFFDGLVEERGWIDVRMDFERNILGEAKIRWADPRSVVLDPEANEYDPDTWKEVTLDQWMSLDDIELYYGKDAREKVVNYASMGGSELSSEAYDVQTFGDNKAVFVLGSDKLLENQIKNVRVIERQYRVIDRIREFVDPATGRTRVVPSHWDEGRIQAVAKEHDLLLRRRFGRTIRWVVSTYSSVLLDEVSPYEDFTLIPYFPIFRRGRPRGLVRYLMDAQEYLNKAESQTLHIINTTANSGWVVEAGSLVNMDVSDLEKEGAATGLVVVYGRGRKAPEKIQPNTIPTGIENFANRANEYITSTTGAGALMGGMPSSEVAGVTLSTARASALVTIQPFFDSLRITRTLLGRKLMRLIQCYYTEPRVYTVTDWRDPSLTQQEVAINIQAANEIVNNVTLGVYDVVVSSMPSRDTFEDTQFAEALQLREAGVPIPAYHVVLASHLVGKRKIAEEVRQIEGLGDPTPMQLMMEQLQVQQAQLALAKMEAEVINLRASAGLTEAKAQATMSEAQRAMLQTIQERELDIAKFKADVLKAAANLQNKIELAQMHIGANESTTRYNALMGANQNEEDRHAQLTRDVIGHEYKLRLEETRGVNQRRQATASAGKRNALAGRNRSSSGRNR